MSDAKVESEQYVAVEAPLQIQPGQNFYDQPPFNLVFAHLALTAGLNVEQLKVLTAKLAEFTNRLRFTGELKEKDGSGAFFAERALAELGSHLKPYEVLSTKGGRIHTRDGIQATRALLRDLSPYPYWFDYINVFVTPNGMIRRDGSWNESASAIPIDSYAVYAQKQMERSRASNEALFRSTMAEIFPQDFRTNSPSVTISRRLVQRGVITLTTNRKP